MPEFLTLLPPDNARALLLSNLTAPLPVSQAIETNSALNRVTAEDIRAPHPLPEFQRTTVDGYAVRARDTFGASETLPAYLKLVGEVPMGDSPAFTLNPGECALIHTGGMLPPGADSVVMLEYTQPVDQEIEILRAVADGENIIRIGEDVAQGQVVLPQGSLLRPAEIGGLMALGITNLRVVARPKVALLSTGDEVIDPARHPRPGQVRDINTFTLASLIEKAGGEPVRYGIIPDQFDTLQKTAARALQECDVVIITAGSSASTRDMTAQVIGTLGAPGVLVHGLNTRPGKPTILGVCGGKAVIGLPGNPVSALVNGYMMVVPVIERLLGQNPRPRPSLRARLTLNLASQAGREDWWPVKLLPSSDGWSAEPIFGKSNLIFTLAAADGLIKIHADATGLAAGEMVEVFFM
jgi:molybdopterin molybdotransferase